MNLQGHILKVKATLLLANPDEAAAVKQVRLNQADKTKLTRDHNGFRKLLIVVTKAGKVLALHTGDGHIVWSLLVPSLRASRGSPSFVPVKLLPWQIPHQHALDENPVVLIISQAGCATFSCSIVSLLSLGFADFFLHIIRSSHTFFYPLCEQFCIKIVLNKRCLI
jgi:hypothetical protein